MLYGYLATKSAGTTIRAIKEQARITKKEVNCLQDPTYTPREGVLPCPVVWSNIRTWWGGEPMRPSEHPATHENDDGATVIDITDPFSPSLCFLNLGTGTGVEGLPVGEPLSAETYIRHYFPSPPRSPNEASKRQTDEYNAAETTVKQLEDTPLIDRAILNNVWPGSIFELHLDENEKGKKAANKAPRIQVDDTNWLRDGLIQALTENAEFRAIVAAERERERLGQLEQEGLPDSCMDLLLRAVTLSYENGRDRSEIDLSGLSLRSEQVVQVVDSFSEATKLDLSRCPGVTPGTLAAIVATRPQPLQELVLFHNPQLHESDDFNLDSLREEGCFESVTVHDTNWGFDAIAKSVDQRSA
ncbi:hypothetical protein FRB99_000588 [Tulasnella sp. 403]|nr:hypothetical protein FRB99_000588 [Tulasnella sp. 403]